MAAALPSHRFDRMRLARVADGLAVAALLGSYALERANSSQKSSVGVIATI